MHLPQAGPELSVIVRTLNARDNVAPLVRELAAALADVRWEVIFVDDDSTDGTADEVRKMVREFIDATLPHTTACVMPGCEIDSFSPTENVVAMIEAARSHRLP